jgi:NAD(P)-dependent dehydrogenase (short-subunit alcohol dehydrogenase family)
MTDKPFSGLTALVTGGASGIGLATANLLAFGGAKVVALDLAPHVEAPLFGIQCDVSNDASVKNAVQAVIDRFGQLDIVINNAGIGAQGTVARAALPFLTQSNHASIVNTGSIAAWAGIPQRALYSATKGAVHALTLAMAADHVHAGIRVNAVAPGTADTPWIGRLLEKTNDPEAERAALAARQPMGRLVTANEVAAAVCYLASPAAGSTTGSILAVDGGMYGLRLRPNT